MICPTSIDLYMWQSFLTPATIHNLVSNGEMLAQMRMIHMPSLPYNWSILDSIVSMHNSSISIFYALWSHFVAATMSKWKLINKIGISQKLLHRSLQVISFNMSNFQTRRLEPSLRPWALLCQRFSYLRLHRSLTSVVEQSHDSPHCHL